MGLNWEIGWKAKMKKMEEIEDVFLELWRDYRMVWILVKKLEFRVLSYESFAMNLETIAGCSKDPDHLGD